MATKFADAFMRHPPVILNLQTQYKLKCITIISKLCDCCQHECKYLPSNSIPFSIQTSNINKNKVGSNDIPIK